MLKRYRKAFFFAKTLRIIVVFTQKFVIKLSQILVWDPGSGLNLFRIPDPESKKAPDPGSESATLFTTVPRAFTCKNKPKKRLEEHN